MSHKLKLLYAALIVLAIVTFWPSETDRDASKIHVWKAHVDETGRVNVLGVVLGQSTLKEAEAALHSQSERALFVEMENESVKRETIEAFFPTSPDRAKIIVELDAPEDLLARIKQRAYNPMAFPSGNLKLEIAPEHSAELEQLSARSLTYIPPVSLDMVTIEHQFGVPAKQIRDLDANLHLLYPDLGLDVVLPREGNPLLQFVPLDNFDRLLGLIKTEASTTGEQ